MKYAAYFFSFLCLAYAISFAASSFAQEPMAPIVGLEDEDEIQPTAPAPSDGKWTNLIYFTGIGCPHCAKSDPVVLKSRLRRGDVMVFEYEIYRDSMNVPLLMEYNKAYGAKLAVPQIIAGSGKADILSGDTPVLKELDTLIALNKGNDVLLSDASVSFDELSLIKLPYKPNIWFKDRVAIREDSSSLQSDKIKAFLLTDGVPKECGPVKNTSAPLSGGKVKFKNACQFDGWILMYD
jgi:hypothetical protein